MAGDAPYHRGDLRTKLVDASGELLGEVGLAGFSVAAVARRLGVSTAAPYRHFRDRDALLAAVATRAAGDLAVAMSDAAEAAGTDPVHRFAATAGAYVRFVGARGAGFDVIFAAELRPLRDADLAAAGRDLMTLLLGLTEDACALGPAGSLELLEQHLALAHGYTTMNAGGFLDRARLAPADVPARATRASAALVRGVLAAGQDDEPVGRG